MLYFSYYNNSKIYLSFHLDWWQNKKIDDFKYLFDFFKTNCPQSDVCEYIKQNPFASLLFEPINNAGVLIKKNIPAIIIGYNQYTYIKNMVSQLEKYTSDIIIIDNNSSYKPLLNYYKNDFKYTLLQQKTNKGHTVYQEDSLQKLTGDVFILTDPDLEFNSKLPINFIQNLIDISNYFQVVRAGFALEIDSDDINTTIKCDNYTIKDWEIQFWKKQMNYPNDSTLKLFSAPIDTTFSLVNKRWLPPNHFICHDNSSIRVAGNYTCKHLPWYKNFKNELDLGEYEAYLNDKKSGAWFY